MIISKSNSSLLNKQELSAMADVMSSAFLSHSNFIEMIQLDSKRKKALYHLFLMMYKVINKYGYIYVVNDENPIGYITFMDGLDKHQISLFRVIKTNGLLNFIHFIFQLKFSEIKKFIKYMSSYSKYHSEKKLVKSIHLYAVGVKKSHKGLGHISKAIRETIVHFRNMGFETMNLETSDSSNLPIYEKIGFKLVTQVSIENSDQEINFLEYNLHL